MKRIDLRRQALTVEDLLHAASGETVGITSRDGIEYILEAADAFEREAAELGRSETFWDFLAERSAEPGRRSLADVERRLGQEEGGA